MAKRFDFDAPDCTCGYRNGIVARNMVGHTEDCPVYARWMAEHGQAYQPQPSAAGPAKDTTLTMLYQVCPLCEGKGEFRARSNRDAEEKIRSCPCKTLRVVEVGVTVGQLEGLAQRDQMRQAANVTAAMLRDGRLVRIMAAARESMRLLEMRLDLAEIDDAEKRLLTEFREVLGRNP